MEQYIDSLVPVRNRPGLFAVVLPSVKQRITEADAKLYMTQTGVVVETLSRNRFTLRRWDPGYRVVCVAITGDRESAKLVVS